MEFLVINLLLFSTFDIKNGGLIKENIIKIFTTIKSN